MQLMAIAANEAALWDRMVGVITELGNFRLVTRTT
jgi:hypothetical protein